MNAPTVFKAGASTLAAVPQAGGLAPLSAEALIAKAIDAGVPVDTLERLLAMRAELRREEARAAFFDALSQFQAAIPTINKAESVTVRPRNGAGYSYRYADLATIAHAIGPALAACRLSITYDTQTTPPGFLVTCTVHHIEGHSLSASFPVPIEIGGRMNPAQAAGSALTYGRRYALCSALGIVTAEDDDDARGTSQQPTERPGPDAAATQRQQAAATRPISEAQHRRLEARIHELGLDRERVKSWTSRAWGVEHFPDLPADRYSDLDQRLDLWADAARPMTSST